MDALTISAGVQGRHVFLESNVLVAISPSCCQLAVHEAGGWSLLLLRRVVTAAAAAAWGCNLHTPPVTLSFVQAGRLAGMPAVLCGRC